MGTSSQLLVKLLHVKPERMGLALLSLALAKEEYAELDVAHYLESIAALADRACDRLPPRVATGDILYAMNTLLFDEEGFACQSCPEEKINPHFHHLLESRQGSRESLTVLYLTLARLLNLPLQCASLSGRLLLCLDESGEESVIDPCARGVVLTHDELQGLLTDAIGATIKSQPCYLPFMSEVSDCALMVRMLIQHKEHYLLHCNYRLALKAVEMILDLAPDSDCNYLERARLLELLHQPEAAAAGYLHYLEKHPDSQWFRDLRLRAQLLLSDPTIIH